VHKNEKEMVAPMRCKTVTGQDTVITQYMTLDTSLRAPQQQQQQQQQQQHGSKITMRKI
jgi:hypothetical protein